MGESIPSFMYAFYNYKAKSSEYTQKNTNSMSFIMIGSAGYFSYDLIVCLYFKLYDFWLVLHHFASIAALIMASLS